MHTELLLAGICIMIAMFTVVCNKQASPRDIVVVCLLAIAGICVLSVPLGGVIQ